MQVSLVTTVVYKLQRSGIEVTGESVRVGTTVVGGGSGRVGTVGAG